MHDDHISVKQVMDFFENDYIKTTLAPTNPDH